MATPSKSFPDAPDRNTDQTSKDQTDLHADQTAKQNDTEHITNAFFKKRAVIQAVDCVGYRLECGEEIRLREVRPILSDCRL